MATTVHSALSSGFQSHAFREMAPPASSSAYYQDEPELPDLQSLFASSSFALVTPRDLELLDLEKFLRAMDPARSNLGTRDCAWLGAGFGMGETATVTPRTTPLIKSKNLAPDLPFDFQDPGLGRLEDASAEYRKRRSSVDWSSTGAFVQSRRADDSHNGRFQGFRDGLRAPTASRERPAVDYQARPSATGNGAIAALDSFDLSSPPTSHVNCFGIDFEPQDMSEASYCPFGSIDSTSNAYPSPVSFTQSPPHSAQVDSSFYQSVPSPFGTPTEQEATFHLSSFANRPSSYNFDGPRLQDDADAEEDSDDEMEL